MALKIGFRGKYYTLWEYTTEYKTNDMGVIFRHDNWKFLKNISFNREKAFAKYPEATWDESLEGRRGSFHTTTRIMEYNKFHCGKYMGRLFDACTDYNYMMWFYNTCANDDQKVYLLNLLKEQGYGFASPDSVELITPKAMQRIKDNEARHNASVERFEKQVPFVLNMTKNLNYDGIYFAYDLQINVKFPDYKRMYYDGYYYSFPIDAKGHAKRVKGKQVFISNYIFDGETVLVQEWKFA